MTPASSLAWAGLVAGVGVLGFVGALLSRTLTPALEIRRYGEDVVAAIDAIAANTNAGAELLRTRDLALTVPALARRLTGEEL